MNKSSTSVTSVSHQARVSNGGQRGAEQEVATIFHSLAISSPRTHPLSLKNLVKAANIQTDHPLSGTIKILSAFNICENFVCVFSFFSPRPSCLALAYISWLSHMICATHVVKILFN